MVQNMRKGREGERNVKQIKNREFGGAFLFGFYN